MKSSNKKKEQKRKHTNKEAERESTHDKAPIGWAEREHSHLQSAQERDY